MALGEMAGLPTSGSGVFGGGMRTGAWSGWAGRLTPSSTGSAPKAVPCGRRQVVKLATRAIAVMAFMEEVTRVTVAGAVERPRGQQARVAAAAAASAAEKEAGSDRGRNGVLSLRARPENPSATRRERRPSEETPRAEGGRQHPRWRSIDRPANRQTQARSQSASSGPEAG